MAEIKIDFTQYSLQELLDCRENIDQDQYPDRAREVDLLIKDRSQQSRQNSNQENKTEDESDVFGFGSGFKRRHYPSVKGFLPNLGVGVSEIVLGIIIWFAFGEFGSEISGTNDITWMFIAFISVSSIVNGVYHLFKSFSVRKISSTKGKSHKGNKDVYENRNDSVVKRN